MFREHLLRATLLVALAWILVALGAVVLPVTAGAANGIAWIKHRGVNLMALEPAAGATFDVDIVGKSRAIGKLRAALDTLLDRSPHSVALDRGVFDA